MAHQVFDPDILKKPLMISKEQTAPLNDINAKRAFSAELVQNSHIGFRQDLDAVMNTMISPTTLGLPIGTEITIQQCIILSIAAKAIEDRNLAAANMLINWRAYDNVQKTEDTTRRIEDADPAVLKLLQIIADDIKPVLENG